MEAVVLKNDSRITQSNIAKRIIEKRALDILYKSNKIDESVYTKMQEKINVKYSRLK